ncbi:MAG: hypothetical protein P4L51_10485 [Puia sp.]|nr:hypothetical protein [Puia sp.]
MQQSSLCGTNGNSYPHFYLCNYLPGSVGRDTFSNSLLKFKKGEHPDQEGWIDCTLEQSADLPIGQDTIILRALHHDEAAINPRKPVALDLLGKALAARFKCRYLPGLLYKIRPVEEIKKLTRDQRVTALQDVYRFSPPSPIQSSPNSLLTNHHSPLTPSLPHSQSSRHSLLTTDYSLFSPYLVLDDIVTTGSTLNAIFDAILREYRKAASLLTTDHSLVTDHPSLSPSPLIALSLAKADYDSSFNLFHNLQGRNYRLDPGQSGWLLAEEEEVYPSVYSLPTLTSWIRTDSFPRPSPP